MWRLAECQLRPEGRAPMFSIERTRRGIDKVHKALGLTECEVLVRFNSPRYGMVDMRAPAGTLPRGEGGALLGRGADGAASATSGVPEAG